MAFEKLATLDTDSAVTIGGEDKKTGKPNPESIEGYFLGTKALGPNKFNKSKTDYMHIFQTRQGNIGVWGKTHMDRQLLNVTPGTMVRVTFAGTRDVGKGNDMNCYTVEVDKDNTIEVNLSPSNTPVNSGDEADDGDSDSGDDSPSDEVTPVRASAPRQVTPPPSAASQARTRALLGGGKSKPV